MVNLSDKVMKSSIEDDAFYWASDVRESLNDYIRYSKINGDIDPIKCYSTIEYLKDKYGEYPTSDEHAIKLIFGNI